MKKNSLEIKRYIRDGRAPIPVNESTSKVMSANRAKNTTPEVLLRKALYKNGIKGYRLHKKTLPGRPDIAFTRKKLAVFINGCFWHRCPNCNLPLPKSNNDFWKEKFDTNITRDQNKINLLVKEKWKVLVIWECQIKNELDKSVKKIEQLLKHELPFMG